MLEIDSVSCVGFELKPQRDKGRRNSEKLQKIESLKLRQENCDT